MFKFFTDIKIFFKEVTADERIPTLDKKILLGMVVLIVSPLDFIPDWIRFVGLLDDLIFISFIFDYFFSILDSRILLSHYRWGMKSFARFRSVARFLQIFVPDFIKKRLWSYVGDAY